MILRLVVLIGSLFVSTLVAADSWTEREILERYLYHSDKLTELLKEAQLSTDPHRRATLDYDLLEQDSENINMRIRHYLDAPTQNFRRYVIENGAE